MAANAANEDPVKALDYSNEALELAQRANHPASIGNTYFNQGLLYKQRNDERHALDCFIHSLKIREQAGNTESAAFSNIEIGNIFARRKDFNKALEYYNKTLTVWDEVRNYQGASMAYTQIGQVFYEQGTIGKALNAFENALEYSIQLEDFKSAAAITNKMGSIHAKTDNPEQALVAYRQSLNFHQQIKDIAGVAKAYNSITEVIITEAKTDPDYYEEARENADRALSLWESLGDPLQIATTKKNIGKILLGQDKTQEGYAQLEASQAIIQQLGTAPKVDELYAEIANAYAEAGNFETAFSVHKTYAQYHDSLFNKAKATAIHDLETRYTSEFETEQKSRAIEKLTLANQVQRSRQYAALAVILLGGILMSVLFFSYRRKQKDNQLLAEQKDIISQQSAEIQMQNDQLEDNNAKLDDLNQKLIAEMGERESIEKASFERNHFLATLSHEMRTPMNAILGMTHLLLSENPTQEQLTHLETLHFSANSLTTLIHDVLDFSKIESGKITFEKKEFSLTEQLKKITNDFRVPLDNRNLKLILETDEFTPEMIRGDAKRLRQIISNLLSISINNTRSGGVELHTEVLHTEDQEVTLGFTISDTGLGFNMKKLEAMFNNFSPANYDQNSLLRTSGLGLTIAKRLVELQDGTLSVDSIPGEGNTFTISMKFLSAEPEAELAPSEVAPVDYSYLKNKNILIVEDNKINQLVVAKILKKYNIKTSVANHGKEALQIMEQENFDLVLMDIQMPVMDGYQATSEIRRMPDSRKSTIPIIALTASAFVTEKEKAVLFGMNDHVGKPFTPDQLMAKIHACMPEASSENNRM